MEFQNILTEVAVSSYSNRTYLSNYHSVITSSLYPFIGPRDLNTIGTGKFNGKRISTERMRSYYSFLKGSKINMFGDAYDLNIGRFDYSLPKTEVIDYGFHSDEVPYCNGLLDMPRVFSHHRPFKQWCVEFEPEKFLIRNEIDSVGFSGMLIEREGFLRECAKAFNILPSLHAPRHESFLSDSYCYTQVGGNYNYVAMKGWNGDKIFVEVTDYDCLHLAMSSHYWSEIDGMIGKKGYVYQSTLNVPPLNIFDGYRFWHYLYNVESPYRLEYFSGSSLREHRKLKEKYELHGDEFKLFEEIQLQGAIMSMLSQSYENFNEIGTFAKNANNVTDNLAQLKQQPWFEIVLNFTKKVGENLAQLVKDFQNFYNDPSGFVKELINSCHYNIEFPEHKQDLLTWFGILGLGGLLYEHHEIIATTLYIFSLYNIFNQLLTDKKVVRIATILMTLILIGCHKATQLRSASITLQGGDNLSSMIYTAVAFITMSFGAKNITSENIIKHLFNNTKDIFSMSRGTLALGKCVEYILDAIKTSFQFAFGDTFVYKALIDLSITSENLKKYVQYCLTTQPDELAVKLTLNQESREEWEQVCKLHTSLVSIFASGKPPTETHIGYNMYVRAASAFQKLRSEYNKIKDALDHFRPEPFMVWIWGKPGTGKTWCRDRFVNNMYRWHSRIDPLLLDLRTTGLLYVRNPADKFMSKYNGEFGVAYDDVGQNRQPDNPEFNEIMGFGSTNQVRLHMADLEEKGRLFSSKVVIMAANSKNVVSNNLILKEEAFNRRRHIVIELQRPLKISTELSLTTSKYDFSVVRLVLSDPITGEQIAQFPKEGYGEDNEVFREMLRWLKPRYEEHVRDQISSLKEKERALEALINGKKDPSIVDDEIDEEEFQDTIEPIVELTKYSEIYKLSQTNDECKMLLDGIRNCFEDGMEMPTDLIRNEFNAFCEQRGLKKFSDSEWRFLKNNKQELNTDLSSLDVLWNDSLKKLETKHHWVKLLAAIGSACSFYALFKMCRSYFNKDEKDVLIQKYSNEIFSPPKSKVEIQKYSNEIKAPSSNKVQIQNYSHETKAPQNHRVQIQEGLTDFQDTENNIDLLTTRIGNGMARIVKTSDLDIKTFRIMNAFNVCFDIWLVPRHFFSKEITDCMIQIQRSGCPPEIVNISKEQIYSYTTEKDGKERLHDLCLVRIPSLPHGRKNLKHFATREQLMRTRNFNGKILGWNATLHCCEHMLVGDVLRWDTPINLDNEGNTLHYAQGYKYNFPTKMGDCGSLLVSLDSTTPARIFGVHFGFDNIEKRGLSYNIPREDLEIMIERIIPLREQITSMPPKVLIQQSDCPQSLIDERGCKYFEYLGYVKDGPLPPRDHGDLHRSPLFNEVYEAEKDLSVLSNKDPRIEKEFKSDTDILTKGVVDFAMETLPWPEEQLTIACVALQQELNSFKTPVDKRILTIDEAINGIWSDGTRLEYTEPLNLKTSAGYGLTGIKRNHFTTTEIMEDGKLVKVESVIKTQKLQKQVDEMWTDWLEGRTHSIPWSHTLKIEPLKMSKIKTGNTRTFCVASTALLINVRRLFGSFTAAMKSSKIKSFSCLGVDANSGEWNDLYNNLSSTGQLGADMDFFKFDRTAVTWQLARKVCEAINRWYNDGDLNARARIIAFEEMIFAYGLVNKHLTRKQRGNPSGNPLTTELNNCINYLMFCIVYLIIAKRNKPECYTIKAFKKYVNLKTFGDDIIFTLHPECIPWFDFKLLQEIYQHHGVPVTPADKNGTDISLKPLRELTFLKRMFREFDHPFVKWQSALDKTSIRSMIQFYRLKPNNGTMLDAILTNCEESLVEAYHWGQDFYEEHKKKINEWMIKHDYPQLYTTYSELDVVFREKLKVGL